MRISYLSMLTLLLCVPPAWAAEPVELDSLEAVLQKESDGLPVNRRERLQQIKAADDASRWQSGFVSVDRTWKSSDSLSESSKRYDEYISRRAKAAQTGDAQYLLGLWCQKNKLASQCMAQMYAALRYDTNHLGARKALGHVFVDGRWFTPADLAQANEQRRLLQESYSKWGPQVQEIAFAISQGDETRRNVAFETLQQINDPAAILGLEAAAFYMDENSSIPFISAIGKQSHPNAALSLARIALASNSVKVQELAISKLRKFPQEAYIPDVLNLLKTPVEYSAESLTNEQGQLVINRYLAQEGMLLSRQHLHQSTSGSVQTQYVSLDPSLNAPHFFFFRGYVDTKGSDYWLAWRGPYEWPFTRPGKKQANLTNKANDRIDEVLDQRNMWAELMADEAAFKKQVDLANEQQKVLDAKVYALLEQTTGISNGPDPKAWWDWWQNHNERYVTRAAKPYQTTYSAYQALGGTVDRVVADNSHPVANYTCLVAGSMIQTSNGLKAIEQLQAGDLVLSKSAETGELALKPVLLTTTRPPKETIKVHTDRDMYQSTAGHRWWVSGKGWLMTKELEPGMNLHTTTGTATIREIVADENPQPTYNLVVEDFHTYFVGEDQILSYDNTMPTPTLNTVPGFKVATK